MLVEWILAHNGHTPTYRFVQKISALQGSVQFPALIGSRPWLKDRLVALYEKLEPLRGTIIHTRHFKGTDGTLKVSSSKGGTVGPEITIPPADLRNLALILVSLLRYLEGTWTMDLFHEKRVRRALDELAHLHGLQAMGQLPPGFVTVRVYRVDRDPIQCDMDRIRRDVSAKRHGQDILFDLRIIAVAPDGTSATAYLLPWEQLQDPAPQLRKTAADLAPYIVTLPADLDTAAVAADLKSLP